MATLEQAHNKLSETSRERTIIYAAVGAGRLKWEDPYDEKACLALHEFMDQADLYSIGYGIKGALFYFVVLALIFALVFLIFLA